jgi:exodeoxyribonuclease VII small subunit
LKRERERVPRKKTDTAAFEPSLKRLEEIVGLLEGGELSLEESLALFEEGVGLSRKCLDVLTGAERKVEQLVGKGAVAAFEPEPSGGEGS